MAELDAQSSLRICYVCGAAVETLGMPEDVLSARNANNMLEIVKDTILRDEDAHNYCPPLMNFLSNQLPVLEEFRKENSETVGKLTNIGMMRELLHMVVDETFLVIHYDVNSNSVTYGQRVQFTGLSCNADMRNFLKRLSPISK